jgi:hypothetical protein
MNIFRRKLSDSELMSAKLGIIHLCRYCKKRIHLVDSHGFAAGILDAEDGAFIWVHDKTLRTWCNRRHYSRWANPLYVEEI